MGSGEAPVRIFGLLSVRLVHGAGRRPVAGMTEPEIEILRRRQRERARIMALAARRVRRAAVLHHHRQDRAELVTAATIERSNARTALMMAAIVLAMLGLAFASVPLYRLFCQVTGFDGTPQRAERRRARSRARSGFASMPISTPALPWRVEPEQRTVRIAPGRADRDRLYRDKPARRADHRHRDLQRQPRPGRPIFQQDRMLLLHRADAEGRRDRAHAGRVLRRSRRSPTDKDTKEIDEITLSYTFYPVESAAAAR